MSQAAHARRYFKDRRKELMSEEWGEQLGRSNLNASKAGGGVI